MNKKLKWLFNSLRLGLNIFKTKENKYLINYGHTYGMESFKTINEAIENAESWTKKRITNLQKDIKEYERFLRYIKKIKGE